MSSETTTTRAPCLGGCGSTKTTPGDYSADEEPVNPLAGDGLCHDCAKRLGALVALTNGRVEIGTESAAWLVSTRTARDAHMRASGRAYR